MSRRRRATWSPWQKILLQAARSSSPTARATTSWSTDRDAGMAAVQRYLFDQSFDSPGGPAARGSVTPAEPTFSRAELSAAEARARTEGHAAGLAEATGRQEAEAAAALAAIERHLASAMASEEAMRRDGERQAVALTRIVLGKLFPALTRRDGLAEIEALVAAALAECLDEPRLVLRLPDALFAAAQSRLEPLAARRGFAGRLIILADDSLGSSDCRIEWADGGAER